MDHVAKIIRPNEWGLGIKQWTCKQAQRQTKNLVGPIARRPQIELLSMKRTEEARKDEEESVVLRWRKSGYYTLNIYISNNITAQYKLCKQNTFV